MDPEKNKTYNEEGINIREFLDIRKKRLSIKVKNFIEDKKLDSLSEGLYNIHQEDIDFFNENQSMMQPQSADIRSSFAVHPSPANNNDLFNPEVYYTKENIG